MYGRLALILAGVALAAAAIAYSAGGDSVQPLRLADLVGAEARAAPAVPGETPLPRLVLEDARVDPRASVAYVTARLVPEAPPTTTVVAEVSTRNGSDLNHSKRVGLPTVSKLIVFRAGDPPVQSLAVPLDKVSHRTPGSWFEVLGAQGQTGLSDSRLLARVTFEPGAANRPAPFKPRPEARPAKGALAYELDVAAFKASDPGGPGVARTRYQFGRFPEGDIGYYTDPVLHPGTRSWEVRGDELILRGEKFDKPLEVEIDGRKRRFEYGSSVLEWAWLSQLYGYYEVEAMTSSARGTWSAFWLLPTDDTWPPEIDIFEHPRNGQILPGHTTTANHWKDAKGAHRSIVAHHKLDRLLGRPIDTTREFHTYGVDWRKDYTTYYFDGREIWRTPTRFHKPAFPLLDVAIAGKWAGPPDLSTGTSEMRIRSLKVWK